MGFHLATQANPREAVLLFYIASAAKTVGEALALFERYFRIVNEAVRLKLVRVPKGVKLQVGFVGLSRFHAQQNAEFGIAVILKALREVGGRNIRPTRVGVHARPCLQSPEVRALLRLSGRVPGIIRLPRILGSDVGSAARHRRSELARDAQANL